MTTRSVYSHDHCCLINILKQSGCERYCKIGLNSTWIEGGGGGVRRGRVRRRRPIFLLLGRRRRPIFLLLGRRRRRVLAF
ncbi:unnamed protein product [Echinostoma caproni]|uniref:Uncharacterized protein n=1 Tax=Echinostoma caproni TaxID=27848 RepID=A0A183AVM2_9TREM|nr:unnamed protein product [Echinostoma caproni]